MQDLNRYSIGINDFLGNSVLVMVIIFLGVVATVVLLVALLRGAAYNERSSEVVKRCFG